MEVLKRNTKQLAFALLAIALVPFIIATCDVIFTENKSTVFLGNYHPVIVIAVIGYYAFLFFLGIFWLVRQVIFISRLKNERIQAELALLKNQVSPHFLFNTLNNLYGLVASDTQKSRELILNLSELLRYSIYESEKETAAIGDEILLLKNYIALHQVRYHKQMDIDFHCDADETRQVVPLLFIILLENAFKHGIESLRTNAYIKMSIITSQSQLQFTIENNYEKRERTPGIGLKNLKRRLELTYPDQYELTFLVTETVYRAQLILKK